MKRLHILFTAALMICNSAAVIPENAAAVAGKATSAKSIDEILDSYEDKAVIFNEDANFPNPKTVIFMDNSGNLHGYTESATAYIRLKSEQTLPVSEINEKLAQMYSTKKIIYQDSDEYCIPVNSSESNQPAYELISQYADIQQIREVTTVTEEYVAWERFFAINSELSDEEIISEYPGLQLKVTDFTKNNPMEGYSHLFQMDFYEKKLNDDEKKAVFNSIKKLNEENADFYVLMLRLADKSEEIGKNEVVVYSAENERKMGDANLDGEVSPADAVTILQYLGNKDKYNLSSKAVKYADVYNPGDGITAMDALTIQKLDAGVIDSLPVYES